MPDPLLFTLCAICHTNEPIYTCPRCSSRTCSLTCSKRHKVWSSCNGVRDPTVYRPRSQLATPAGIDHDYNFLSAIERGIDRTDNHIVDDKKLIARKDLLRNWEREHNRRGNSRSNGNAKSRHREPLQIALHQAAVIIDPAPPGLTRARSNGTHWSGKQQCINWQVEWVTASSTTLSKLLDRTPIGTAFSGLLEEQRRATMSKGDKAAEKKRRAREAETEREAKRVRIEAGSAWEVANVVLQDPISMTWDIGMRMEQDIDRVLGPTSSHEIKSGPSGPSGHYFYLLRPHTPASRPKVLIPLDAGGTLETLLRNRVVLEFPTIYVLMQAPGELPEEYSVDGHDFGGNLAGDDKLLPVEEEEDDTSSEGSSEEDDINHKDVYMEEGEIEN